VDFYLEKNTAVGYGVSFQDPTLQNGKENKGKSGIYFPLIINK
jgi:hypothetical protein